MYKVGDKIEAIRDFSSDSGISVSKGTVGIVTRNLGNHNNVLWEKADKKVEGTYSLYKETKNVSSLLFRGNIDYYTKLLRTSKLRKDEYVDLEGKIKRKPKIRGDCVICGGRLRRIKTTDIGIGSQASTLVQYKCENCGKTYTNKYD